MGDVLTDCLLVKVWCAVDEHNAAVVFNQNRGSSTAIVRIGGMAHGAVATNGGHAHGRAHHWLRLRRVPRSEEHTSELQSLTNLVCRLLLEKKKKKRHKK